MCRAKNLRGRHRHIGYQYQIPGRRQFDVSEAFAHSFGEGGVAMNEDRHVGAQRKADSLKFCQIKAGLPQTIQRDQCRRCIRTATAQTAAHRQSLVDMQGDSRGGARGLA